MTKRILLALVLALLTFAPVATAEGFESPLDEVGDWLKEIVAAIVEVGGSIVSSGDPEPDGSGDDEMGPLHDPYGSPVPTNGDGDEMGPLHDPLG